MFPRGSAFLDCGATRGPTRGPRLHPLYALDKRVEASSREYIPSAGRLTTVATPNAEGRGARSSGCVTLWKDFDAQAPGWLVALRL